MSTALISPLYGLYKEAWHLQTSDVSVIYVVYMAGALCGLLFLGRLSDRIGFHKVMQISLGLILVGTLLSMLAWNTTSLNAARLIVGLASSLMTTGASVGLRLLLSRHNTRKASMLTTVLIALGFGLGPLVGGVIGQWVTNPLVMAYVPTLVLGSLGIYALRRISIPDHVSAITASSQPLAGDWKQWLPKLTWPQSSDSMAFILTVISAFLAFSVFSLYASMAPLFLEKMIDWQGPFISGAAIAVILLISAGVQLLVVRLPTRWSGFVGFKAFALCSALLLVNLELGSMLLLAAGILVTAIGHGMCLLAGMNMVNRIAESHNHSGLLATYLVVGYCGSMIPILGVGWIADYWGMQMAVSLYCYGVIAIGVIAAFCFFRHPRMLGE
ncbi:MFS transporter [Marinobacterium sp. YM272]|uniref:MFS transporter n=1 Tax=Marinobacterium sp. YM272 TaxID=3421654 RepID=UPI003D7FF4BC